MRPKSWKRWALAMLSGGIALQTTGCADAAVGVMTLASAVTAGGVLYIIQKIMD